MIQDIFPSVMHNTFVCCTPDKNDYFLRFDVDGKLLVRVDDHQIRFLTGTAVSAEDAVYLFSVDEQRYFLLRSDVPPTDADGFAYYSLRELRSKGGQKELFAVYTAYHLWKWYHENQYCGCCREAMTLHPRERALLCPKCGHIIYPRINPAVIVGVIKDDRILVTRYRKGYAHNALIAGFTEIGETLEQTVSREVMEEVGLKVKNIRYYKSQPWGSAQDLLVGFYCEADGDADIHMDENELKYAEWIPRDAIELQPDAISLTNEMMERFKNHQV